MARPVALATLALLPVLLAAGCVSTAPVDPAAADGGAGSGATSVAPASADDAIAYLHGYVMTHPFRLNNLPTHEAARDSLEKELASFGLAVERHAYDASTPGVNVLGIKNGTTRPDEWIVLSAHYDTAESTVYGAWDDGAGTAMLLALAKAAQESTFERTVVYAFFDGEEQGLLGSQAFVQDYQERATLVANLNFDPPGLNWPCRDAQGFLPVKIIFNDAKVEEGVRGYPELKAAVLAGLDAAEVPEDVRDFDSGIPIATLAGVGLRGTSDHASFDKVDVPNVFIGSAPTSRAGPAAALTYLLHTPLDTVQQMEARCGGAAPGARLDRSAASVGADLMKQAFQVEMDVTLTALAALDAEPALSPG